MSIALMTAAWALDLSSTDKLVLLALADNANDVGVCWPAVGTIADKCGLSDRAVRSAIRRLELAGHMRSVDRSGTSRVYTIHPGMSCRPTPEADAAPPRHGVPPTPESGSATPEPRSAKPSRTIPQKTSSSSVKRAPARSSPPMHDPLWAVPENWRAWTAGKMPIGHLAEWIGKLRVSPTTGGSIPRPALTRFPTGSQHGASGVAIPKGSKMNAQVHQLPMARREAPVVAPSPTPSLPRTIASALKDSPYREEPWNATDAYRDLEARAALPDVRRLAREHRASLEPVNRAWLKRRLSAMMLAFGHERDPDRVTAWLAETGRLLIDLPGDILATAIDEAIKRSERGFIPAVGQIRAIAEPMVEQRQREARRLEALAGLVVSGGPRPPRPWESQDTYQPVEQCSAAEAHAILEEFGLQSRKEPAPARHHGPPRTPTEADYIAIMGEATWRAAQAGRAAGDAA